MSNKKYWNWSFWQRKDKPFAHGSAYRIAIEERDAERRQARLREQLSFGSFLLKLKI